MTRAAIGVVTMFVILIAGAAAKPPVPSKPVEAEYRPTGCCRGGLYPVCRRVAVTKKKPHVEYSMRCELVCVPGCSLVEGRSECCSCGNAVVREKKTLLKKVTEKEIQSYEYRIIWVCRSCAFGPGCCGEVNR